MTVTIRNPLIRAPRATKAVGVARPPATSAPGTLTRVKPAAATLRTTARAVAVTRLWRRPRYRYALTTLDDMFYRVREPIAVQRAADRRSRRRGLVAFFAFVVLVVGIGIGLAYLILALISGLNAWIV